MRPAVRLQPPSPRVSASKDRVDRRTKEPAPEGTGFGVDELDFKSESVFNAGNSGRAARLSGIAVQNRTTETHRPSFAPVARTAGNGSQNTLGISGG